MNWRRFFRREEADAGLKQHRVRALEFCDEVGRLLPPVHVVAKHDHEVERELLPHRGQLDAGLQLHGIAGAHVADDGELHAALFVRQGCLLGGRLLGRDDRQEQAPGHNCQQRAF